MYVLTDLKEYASHTCILADRHAFVIGNFEVFDDIIKNAASDIAVLASTASADCALDVLGKMSVSVDTKLFNDVCNKAYINFTHFK